VKHEIYEKYYLCNHTGLTTGVVYLSDKKLSKYRDGI